MSTNDPANQTHPPMHGPAPTLEQLQERNARIDDLESAGLISQASAEYLRAYGHAMARVTAAELEAEFERTRRIVAARHTLRVRDELNAFMRINPALTLQECILAVFRAAE